MGFLVEYLGEIIYIVGIGFLYLFGQRDKAKKLTKKLAKRKRKHEKKLAKYSAKAEKELQILESESESEHKEE